MYKLQISQLKKSETKLSREQVDRVVGGITYEIINGDEELDEFFRFVGLPTVTIVQGKSRTSN